MARVSKPPEIRKQELVDAALSLFVKKGYEAVSVRDILKVVNGHPGMFYYYFESKQEIYNEAMRQMIQTGVAERALLISDKNKPVLTRFRKLISLISNGIRDYYRTFNNPESIAYETAVLLNMLTAMAEPISQFMLEAKDEGIIPPEAGITEETAYPMALFLIHGCHGLVHLGDVNDSLSNISLFVPFIARFLNVSLELLEKSPE